MAGFNINEIIWSEKTLCNGVSMRTYGTFGKVIGHGINKETVSMLVMFNKNFKPVKEQYEVLVWKNECRHLTKEEESRIMAIKL